MHRTRNAFHTLRGWRAALLAAGSAAAAALATTVVLAHPAGAIPAAQAGCNNETITITPQNGLVPLTSVRSVTVQSATTLKVEAAADVGVDSGAEVRLAWSVNSSSPVDGQFGPANFADHQQFFETRSTLGLIGNSFGPTKVQPFVRVRGPVNAKATLLNRCSTVEAATS